MSSLNDNDDAGKSVNTGRIRSAGRSGLLLMTVGHAERPRCARSSERQSHNYAASSLDVVSSSPNSDCCIHAHSGAWLTLVRTLTTQLQRLHQVRRLDRRQVPDAFVAPSSLQPARLVTDILLPCGVPNAVVMEGLSDFCRASTQAVPSAIARLTPRFPVRSLRSAAEGHDRRL